MKKKCKVVMLPTNEKADLQKFGRSLRHKFDYVNSMVGIYQHLYITSDDKIKEGDWYIWNNLDDTPNLCLSKGECLNPDNCKKVIVTTDGFINHTDHRVSPVPNFCAFPQPSQSFIQKYVEEYNKGNIITEVMVEYEIHKNSFVPLWIPKIDQDNTINIEVVKDSYSREEVERLIMEYALDEHSVVSSRNLNKWIEENL